MVINKKGKMSGFTMAIMVIAVGLLSVLTVSQLMGRGVQESVLQEIIVEPGEVSPELAGKTATLNTYATDQSADDTSTKAAAKCYIITEPVVSEDMVVPGELGSFAADGTDLSSTGKTSVTAGVTVGKSYTGVCANASWYGAFSPVKNVLTQSEDLELHVWNIASGISVTAKDEDENSIAILDAGAGVNLTLGASESESLDEIKFKNNNSNAAYNLWGFYFDTDSETNLTSITGEGTTAGDYLIGYSKTTTGLGKTSKDDEVFKFDEAILLNEFDQVEANNIQFKADGDGCEADGGETLTLYGVDANWYRSSKEKAMKFGPETDADSPADVGLADSAAKLSIYCRSA